MPIVKPHFTATSTVSGNVAVSTSTTVAPTIRRFLAAITLGMIGVGVTTVPASAFVNDAGGSVTSLPSLAANEYANVFVNGAPRLANDYTLSTSQIVINETLIVGNTVMIQYVASTASSVSTATPNLTVSTTINS